MRLSFSAVLVERALDSGTRSAPRLAARGYPQILLKNLKFSDA